MGVIYVAIPLNDESETWLDSWEIEYDIPDQRGRDPTFAEITGVLARLPNAEVETGRHDNLFEASIERDEDTWTNLVLNDVTDDDGACTVVFEKGSELLILEILILLADKCGPLILNADTGEEPILVNARDTPKNLYDQWNRIRGIDEDDFL